MDVQCVICQDPIQLVSNDLGDSGQRISALVCGHVFHTFCIDKWLEQSHQKSCPKCRFIVNKKQGIGSFQLFVELAPSVEASEDPTVKALKRELELNKNDLKRNREKSAYLKNELDSLKLENSSLKSQLATSERLNSVTNSRLKTNFLELTQCRKQLSQLQNQVQSLRMTNTFVNGSIKDAEEVVNSDALDKSQLGLLCVTYKKDGMKLMKKLEEASDALDRCEREKHLQTAELKRLKSELDELKNERSLPSEVENCDPSPVRVSSPKESLKPKRFRVEAGTSNLGSLPKVRKCLEENYDGLGGHTSSSLFRHKFKVVTSRSIVRK